MKGALLQKTPHIVQKDVARVIICLYIETIYHCGLPVLKGFVFSAIRQPTVDIVSKSRSHTYDAFTDAFFRRMILVLSSVISPFPSLEGPECLEITSK